MPLPPRVTSTTPGACAVPSRPLPRVLARPEARRPVSPRRSPRGHTPRGQGPRRPRRAQDPSRTPAFPSPSSSRSCSGPWRTRLYFPDKAGPPWCCGAGPRRLGALLAATTAAPAGGKRLFSHPGPGSFPTATEATRYGGRPGVKLVSQMAQAEVGGAYGSGRKWGGRGSGRGQEGLFVEPRFRISCLPVNDWSTAK